MNTCRGCGKTIVWGVTTDGERIPLDPRPAVYFIREQEGDRIVVDRAAREVYMVTHFATCPKANDFSGSMKLNGEPR